MPFIKTPFFISADQWSGRTKNIYQHPSPRRKAPLCGAYFRQLPSAILRIRDGDWKWKIHFQRLLATNSLQTSKHLTICDHAHPDSHILATSHCISQTTKKREPKNYFKPQFCGSFFLSFPFLFFFVQQIKILLCASCCASCPGSCNWQLQNLCALVHLFDCPLSCVCVRLHQCTWVCASVCVCVGYALVCCYTKNWTHKAIAMQHLCRHGPEFRKKKKPNIEKKKKIQIKLLYNWTSTKAIHVCVCECKNA